MNVGTPDGSGPDAPVTGEYDGASGVFGKYYAVAPVNLVQAVGAELVPGANCSPGGPGAVTAVSYNSWFMGKY